MSLFKKNISLSAYNDFDGWRGSVEFKSLEENKLIYHCNHLADGAYIRYELTPFGKRQAEVL